MSVKTISVLLMVLICKAAEKPLSTPELFKGYYCFMLFTKLKPSMIESFKRMVGDLPPESTDFRRLSHKFSLYLITQCRRNIQLLSEKVVFEKIYSALSNPDFEQNQEFISPDQGLIESILSDFTAEELESQQLLDQIRSIDQVD